MSKRSKISKNYSSSLSLGDRLTSLSVQFVDELLNASSSSSSSSSLLSSSAASSSSSSSVSSHREQSKQQKILAKLGPIASGAANSSATAGVDQSSTRSGYIVAFVIIFVIVLFILVGRVIYSSNESAAPNIAYLKYHRASMAATALSQRENLVANNQHAPIAKGSSR